MQLQGSIMVLKCMYLFGNGKKHSREMHSSLLTFPILPMSANLVFQVLHF